MRTNSYRVRKKGWYETVKNCSNIKYNERKILWVLFQHLGKLLLFIDLSSTHRVNGISEILAIILFEYIKHCECDFPKKNSHCNNLYFNFEELMFLLAHHGFL